MKYSISADRKFLVISVSKEEQIEFALFDNTVSDKSLYEAFEKLICNSELNWVNPIDTGDLTDAPMLGICENGEVVERWAFMDYMLRSPLEDLIYNGKVLFIGGPLK